MFNITSQEKNANQNHNEILPHTHQEATIKQKNKNRKKSVDKDVDKLESLYTLGGNVKWYSHFRKQNSGSPKH